MAMCPNRTSSKRVLTLSIAILNGTVNSLYSLLFPASVSLYKIRKNSIYTYCHCMGIRQQMAVNVDFVRKTNKAAFAC